MLLDARARRRFRSDGSAMLGLALVVALVLVALLGPLLVSADPNVSDFALDRAVGGGPPGPSATHWLGTDTLFRDLLARVVHGARLSLAIGIAATLLAVGIGSAVGIAAGLIAGTRYRRIDDLLMRIVDVVMAFPYLLLITAIGVAIDRADAFTVTVILGLTSWTGIARVVRAKTIQIEGRAYVTAARALGATQLRIAHKHILPGLTGTLLVIGSGAVAQMILAEAVLGYLTVGIEPPQATWGRMLHEVEHYLGAEPLLIAVPGFAIVLSVLGFTRLGDGLRDAIDTTARPVTQGRARFAVDLLVLCSAVALLGFAEPERAQAPAAATDEGQPRRGGVLRVATSVGINTLDPAVAYDEASRTVNDLVFARLVTFDADGGLVGELAKDYQALDGGKRFRFVLRKGLRFHDGARLGAADVKRSLERMLHPDTPSGGSSLYKKISGYADYKARKAKELTGVTVIDEHTLEIALDSSDATFVSLMTMGFAAPVCPSSGARVDPKVAILPCGAGPFVVKEMTVGQRIVLERFDSYHEQGLPHLDRIEWLLNVPARSQRYRFEAGELDMVTELTGIDSARYAVDNAWERHRAWHTGSVVEGFFLNTEMPPLDNRHIRRAIYLAVDGSILSKIHVGVVDADRVIPASVPGPPRDKPMRQHDLTAALREMDLAGYRYDPASGEGGYPQPIDCMTVPDTFPQSSAEVVQQQLARIGIRIRLRLVAYATWLQLVTQRGQVAMGWRGWGADYPDPASFFESTLVSSAIRENGGWNLSFFANAELDGVVAKARGETDTAARMALYQRAEEIVRSEAPFIPLWSSRKLHIWHPHVRDYRPHPILGMRLREVWKSDSEGTR
jgi:ABC-type dipeptide/oligopeptide/nickel transport system permease subunit/ABC-type transport system substrate-binding protein